MVNAMHIRTLAIIVIITVSSIDRVLCIDSDDYDTGYEYNDNYEFRVYDSGDYYGDYDDDYDTGYEYNDNYEFDVHGSDDYSTDYDDDFYIYGSNYDYNNPDYGYGYGSNNQYPNINCNYESYNSDGESSYGYNAYGLPFGCYPIQPVYETCTTIGPNGASETHCDSGYDTATGSTRPPLPELELYDFDNDVDYGIDRKDRDMYAGEFDSFFHTDGTKKALYYVSTILPPVILVIGLIGNTLIMCMLRKKILKNYPSKIFFAALAITDNITLSLLIYMVAVTKTEKLESRSDLSELFSTKEGCQFFMGTFAILVTLSAWIMMAVTIDRFVGVRWPLKAHVIRAKHRLIVVAAVAVVAGAVDGHVYVGLSGHCVFYKDYLIWLTDGFLFWIADDQYTRYGTFVRYYWPWVRFVVDFLLPFAVIVVCNVSMVLVMRKSASTLTSTKADSGAASRKMARLMIIASSTYIMTMLPLVVHDVMYTYEIDYLRIYSTERVNMRNLLDLLKPVGQYAIYLNKSLNFFIYCLTGANFRHALKDVFRCTNSAVVKRGKS